MEAEDILAQIDAPDAETLEAVRDGLSNIEAEQMVLGAILLNNEAFYRVESILRPEDFSEGLHERIFRTAAKLIDKGHIASPISMAAYFERDPAMADVGGTDYLARIAAWATPASIVTDYARLVHTLAQRRGLIEIGQRLVESSVHAGVDDNPESLISDAEQDLYSLAETGRTSGGFLNFKDALEQARVMAESAFSRDGHLSGVATRLTRLDTLLGALQKSDLIVLAGRPGMGKTSLATNIAFNVARTFNPESESDEPEHFKVAFYSLEMSAEQLATRVISEQAMIPSSDIRRGKITENQYRHLVNVIDELQELPLYIDDTGGLNVAALAARARRQARKTGLDLIIVDYIQLLAGSDKRRGEGRVQEVTEITTNLKALAKELNVPIVALSQLSRAVESRPDKRPLLSDLRESGSIEQDADVVLFVYREEYYKRLEGALPEEIEAVAGKAEVIIAKQRHGPTGDVELSFTPEYTRFGNLETRDDVDDHAF
jgi:replicative DNA helicase